MPLNPASKDKLEEKLQPLQSMHLQMRYEFNRSIILSCVLGFGVFYFLHKVLEESWLGGAVCALGIVWLAQRTIYAHSSRDYRKAFKSRVVPELVKACQPVDTHKANYSPGQSVSEEEFRESRLFRAPDIFTGEDLITARVGTTRVRFSLVEAQVFTPPATGRTPTVGRGTIFKGLFFIADFNKHFHGNTVIGTDSSEELLGRLGRVLERAENLLTASSSMQVHLEDPEFERLFNVYSTDQVEARYILTPSFMQRLTSLRSRFGSDIYVSFHAGQMLMAMPLRHGWLEPPPFYKPLNIESLQPCIDQLQLAFGLVEELNLNTRIWSK